VRSGVLHLLLYVSPMLYVDGVGSALQEIPQTSRVITVSPDYLFEIWHLISVYWPIWAVILTAIIIPLGLWLKGKLSEWRNARDQSPVGFRQ